VLHEADADAVAEEITQQALDETRRAREQLAHDHDAELDGDERRDGPPRPSIPLRRHHAVDDELSDPQRDDRNECANEPEHAPSRR
jgi:hypothetical protein